MSEDNSTPIGKIYRVIRGKHRGKSGKVTWIGQSPYVWWKIVHLLRIEPQGDNPFYVKSGDAVRIGGGK